MIVAFFTAGQAMILWGPSPLRVQQQDVVVLRTTVDGQQLHVDASGALADACSHLDAQHGVEKGRLAAALDAHNGLDKDALPTSLSD